MHRVRYYSIKVGLNMWGTWERWEGCPGGVGYKAIFETSFSLLTFCMWITPRDLIIQPSKIMKPVSGHLMILHRKINSVTTLIIVTDRVNI